MRNALKNRKWAQSEGQENVAVAATMEVTEEEYYDEFEDEVTIKLGKSWQ